MDQKSFPASPSCHDESWCCGGDPSNFPRCSCSPPRSGLYQIKVDVLRTWLFHLRLGIWYFHITWALTLPLHWTFLHRFQMRPSIPIPQCLRPRCLLSRFSASSGRLKNWLRAQKVSPKLYCLGQQIPSNRQSMHPWVALETSTLRRMSMVQYSSCCRVSPKLSASLDF